MFVDLINCAYSTRADVLLVQVTSHAVTFTVVSEVALLFTSARYFSKKTSCWVAALEVTLEAALGVWLVLLFLKPQTPSLFHPLLEPIFD